MLIHLFTNYQKMSRAIQNTLNKMSAILSQSSNAYQGTMRSRHLSVALMKNMPITDYKFNHLDPRVLGTYRGSTHAEMDVIQSVLKVVKGQRAKRPQCLLRVSRPNA